VLIAALVLLHALPANAASVDGVNIHWTSHGAGPQTLIFVHCWTCDDTSWTAQVPALSRRYRVITLDLPGHGRSGTPAAFSIDLFVRAIEAVRSEAGLQRVVLAGHGNGAPVIRRYALLHPERVAGLVLVDANLLRTATGVPSEQTLRAMSGRAKRERDIRAMFGEATPPELQRRILKMMLAMPEALAGDILVAIQSPSEWTSEETISVPVLAVYAGPRTQGGWARAIKGLYPMAEYHRIPETGHFLMMEAPEAFNRLVEGFLARITF
jgi:pimeloyl-ACP methyl ester carboxylesterase